MSKFDEIRNFVEKNSSKMVDTMYYIQGQVLARKRHDSKVIWTFNDGSKSEVHFRMSNALNSDKAASIPTYIFNNNTNPSFTLCMSCDGKIFALIDNKVVAEKYKKDIRNKATKGFVGFNLYKNFEDGVELIYVS